jgi:hypothetical protein
MEVVPEWKINFTQKLKERNSDIELWSDIITVIQDAHNKLKKYESEIKDTNSIIKSIGDTSQNDTILNLTNELLKIQSKLTNKIKYESEMENKLNELNSQLHFNKILLNQKITECEQKNNIITELQKQLNVCHQDIINLHTENTVLQLEYTLMSQTHNTC